MSVSTIPKSAPLRLTIEPMLLVFLKLLFECRGLGNLPQVLLMENVNAIHNKKNMPNFQKWLDTLADLGYKTYWQDMNSKDYGVPQNRCRTFAVSLLDERPYIFPEPISLEKRLKDVLEDKVGEEFYINSDKAYQLIVSLVDKGVLPSKSCQQPIDLSTRQPDARDVANCVKTEQRGIINFAQAETGVAIAPYPDKYGVSITGIASTKMQPDADKLEIAHTLLARDWKGLSNFGSTGCVEEYHE